MYFFRTFYNYFPKVRTKSCKWHFCTDCTKSYENRTVFIYLKIRILNPVFKCFVQKYNFYTYFIGSLFSKMKK